MRSIIRVDTKTRGVLVEGRYRTEDQQIRAHRRLLGEHSREGTSILVGEMVRITDPGILSEMGLTELITYVQQAGGWVIREERMAENLGSLRVFVLGNLESTLAQIRARLPHVEVDTLDGPLPVREHVREAGDLPDGKYRAQQKKEADRLAVRGVKECETFEEAIRRAAEILRERPYLQAELAATIGSWRPVRA
jgi:hypothetical protein